MGDLKNIIVGGKFLSATFDQYLAANAATTAVRKNNPCHYFQGIAENTKFILGHFQTPLFPRTISTFRTKGKQINVYDLEDIISEFKKANYIDCKINAFPSIDNPLPDFIFIDIDKNDYVNAETALDKTLKNIKEKLDCSNPTVLHTGNGYHVYQPIDSLRLENIQDFNFVENPSNRFLRFTKEFLSSGYADKCNNPSLKSCLARVPGSFNSKCLAKGLSPERSQVKALQKWSGNRTTMLNLIGSFYAYLLSKKIEEEERAKTNNYSYCHGQTKSRIDWIESC